MDKPSIEQIEKSYIITQNGSVININTGRILKPQLTEKGYLKVSLKINKIPYKYTIHRLVALKFIPNPKKLPQLNHLDLNKTNNNVNNLQWCTHSENIKHYQKTIPNSLSNQILNQAFLLHRIGLSVNDVAKTLNLRHSSILAAINNTTYKSFFPSL